MVLCYLEGMTNEEAARALGWPAGSMSRRLERARQPLRHRLAGRGLSLVLIVVLAGAATVDGAGGECRPRVRGALAVRAAMAPSKPHKEGGRELERLLTSSTRPITPRPSGTRCSCSHGRRGRRPIGSRNMTPAGIAPSGGNPPAKMRLSAVLLAQATDANDEPAMRAAARRLSTSCTQCHLAFRQ